MGIELLVTHTHTCTVGMYLRKFVELSKFILVSEDAKNTSNVIVTYVNNGSARYKDKKYLESPCILGDMGTTRSLKIGEPIAIKTKSRLWKAMVIKF